MILNNLHLPPDNLPVNIKIEGATITSVSANELTGNHPLTFNNAIVFPGLINSHDHLDFNLFPMLGNKTYNNYTEWGSEIHILYKKEIMEVLKIPEPLRTAWGIYKNLLCGVTTVVNHGKYLPVKDTLINVIQQSQDLHSVGFERQWKLKLNNLFKKNIPCVIHAGEGTDKKAEKEIDELINWNFLNRHIIGVHGVAMDEQQALKFKALVWCPASNLFLLNKTAAVDKLKKHTKILFGSDSTLTASWNIWEHIKLAANSGLVDATELLEMLTTNPAAVWELDTGSIATGKTADLLIAETDPALSFPENFYRLNSEHILVVICNGAIRLFDEKLFNSLTQCGFRTTGYNKIQINGRYKYVEGNIPGLISAIKNHYPGAIFPIKTCHTAEIAKV